LNAYAVVMEESAVQRARSLGPGSGPLHGMPVAVKDLFYTRGVRTTAGSRVFADLVTDFDSAVVERLEAAGAVIVGKTQMHELAYGVTSNNPHYGPVRNPWDTSRIPGGSSGGSGATVGIGSVVVAMGSDTGGSIRIPAAYCGAVGIKPTLGRVSKFGAFPLGYTLDHMGPIAATVHDAAACLEAISGYDPRDDSSARVPVPAMVPPPGARLDGVRVGLPGNFFFDRVDPEIAVAVHGLIPVLEAAGATIADVRVPDIAAINAIGRVILLSEASAGLERHLDNRGQFGADVLALFDQGRLIPATDYVNAQRLRRVFQREWDRLWGQVDCVLTPTTPCLPARIGEALVGVGGEMEDVRLASTRFVRSINVLGLPALAVPCGLSESRLPLSAQVIGRNFDEPLVLRVGAAIEAARPLPPCREEAL
jgi:aspartyl-tRNA(Asn)/glutamyl-tRNA(Gln) amidotransferase subunit A